MKKYLVLGSASLLVFIFSNCGSTKKVAAPALLTYENNLKTVIANNCSPCHIPASGGNKRAYDNFANVKTDIDEIIRRIELNPGERGFMPFKKLTKLSDTTIAIFKQWRADGMLEN